MRDNACLVFPDFAHEQEPRRPIPLLESAKSQNGDGAAQQHGLK